MKKKGNESISSMNSLELSWDTLLSDLKKKSSTMTTGCKTLRQSQRVTKVEKKKEKKRKKDLRFAQFRHVGRQVEGDAVGRAGQRGAADEQHQQ